MTRAIRTVEIWGEEMLRFRIESEDGTEIISNNE